MKHLKIPRRRIQRAFYQWLMESREAFAIPVTVCRRRARYLECRMAGISDVLKITLTSYDLVVAVEMGGECWDLLACFDAVPTKIPEGYECTLCDPETRPSYPSREAIWREEIFEPFRNWVNDTLAHSEWVAFYKIGDGFTKAKIGPGPGMMEPALDFLHAVVLLRREKAGQPGSQG